MATPQLRGDRRDARPFIGKVEWVQLQVERGEILPDLVDVVDCERLLENEARQYVGDLVG